MSKFLAASIIMKLAIPSQLKKGHLIFFPLVPLWLVHSIGVSSAVVECEYVALIHLLLFILTSK